MKVNYQWAPSFIFKAAKRVMVYPRYFLQSNRCRQFYPTLQNNYPQKVLFVAGLPKSGTTWLESMLSEIPGFSNVMIPEVAEYEINHGESHGYSLPVKTFINMKGMLAVLKMHIRGTPHNISVLDSASLKFIILHRDLKDVAISYYYYVRKTPWHGEYSIYKNLSIDEGLTAFCQRTLPDYVSWGREWTKECESRGNGIILTYEELLNNTRVVFKRVVEHYGITLSDKEISRIVDEFSFSKQSGGREKGAVDNNSFIRSGVAGGWKNIFTEELNVLYDKTIKETEENYDPVSQHD